MRVSQNGEGIKSTLANYPHPQGELLAILHDIQHTLGYIPPEAITAVAQHLRMSPAQVWGVATFYADFRTEPPAETTVHFCQGPACQLKGAERLRRAAEGVLGIKAGEKTPDGKVELGLAQCPGICHQAPVFWVNGQLHPQATASEAVKLARELKPPQEGGTARG